LTLLLLLLLLLCFNMLVLMHQAGVHALPQGHWVSCQIPTPTHPGSIDSAYTNCVAVPATRLLLNQVLSQ
jgi:hypothetical protein